MKTMRTASIVLTATLALAAPALTACGGIAEQAAEQAVEKAGEAVTGGNVDIEDGGVTVTDESGNAVVAGEDVSMPDSWPAEVPTFDGGTLALASVQADGTAGAMWLADGTPEDVLAAYGATLAGAGFTQKTDSTVTGLAYAEYEGNGYVVGLTAVEADGKTGLTVAVTPSTS